jgi:hypothetical protein
MHCYKDAKMKIVAQHVFRKPSRWCGKPCIRTTVDMGELALALSSDLPFFNEDLLALFPGLRSFGDALARGALIPEVVARLALELQRNGNKAQSAQCTHGKGSEVHLTLVCDDEKLASKAIGRAINIVAALAAAQYTITCRPRGGRASPVNVIAFPSHPNALPV